MPPAAIDPAKPFNREHYRQMVRQLGNCAETHRLIERCNRCGLDFSAEHAENQAQIQLIQRLQAEFFPTGPPGEGE